jgi:hypothetical protein
MDSITVQLSSILIVALSMLSTNFVQAEQQQCLSNTVFEDFFRSLNNVTTLPRNGSCCMKDVCNLPCPTEVERPANGMCFLYQSCFVFFMDKQKFIIKNRFVYFFLNDYIFLVIFIVLRFWYIYW